MRTAMLWVTLVSAVGLSAGCDAHQGMTVVEAESLTLSRCTAEPLAGASGDKAVLMNEEGGEARGSVVLNKGKYEVTTFVMGRSDDEDAVLITVDGSGQQRVWCRDHGSVSQAVLRGTEAPSFTVTVEKDGPCEVLLQMAEKNVYVDRVVLKPLKE